MKFQLQIFRQVTADFGDNPFQEITIRMDNKKIIDIAPVILATQSMFDVMIEIIEINVAEQLRGQIADGQSATRRRMEQALGRRQSVPVGWLAAHDAAFDGIMEDNDFQQINDGVKIERLIPRPIGIGQSIPEFLQCPDHFFIKQLPVNRHEIAFDVKFQDIGALAIITRTRPDKMINALDSA